MPSFSNADGVRVERTALVKEQALSRRSDLPMCEPIQNPSDDRLRGAV